MPKKVEKKFTGKMRWFKSKENASVTCDKCASPKVVKLGFRNLRKQTEYECEECHSRMFSEIDIEKGGKLLDAVLQQKFHIIETDSDGDVSAKYEWEEVPVAVEGEEDV